jgi:hypothetical protein
LPVLWPLFSWRKKLIAFSSTSIMIKQLQNCCT